MDSNIMHSNSINKSVFARYSNNNTLKYTIQIRLNETPELAIKKKENKEIVVVFEDLNSKQFLVFCFLEKTIIKLILSFRIAIREKD